MLEKVCCHQATIKDVLFQPEAKWKRRGWLEKSDVKFDMSHEKNPPTFHYTGWLIGILIMVYDNPYITG